MATIVRAPSKAWKAVIRRKGWPTISKSFRTKRDAEDWARCTEDEMIRGVHIRRSSSELTTVNAALERYLAEVTPLKRPSTQRAEKMRVKPITERLGSYSLATLSSDIVAKYRDKRLAAGKECLHCPSGACIAWASVLCGNQGMGAWPKEPLNNYL